MRQPKAAATHVRRLRFMERGSVLSTQTLPEQQNSVEWAVSRTVITSTLTQSPLPHQRPQKTSRIS